MPRNIIIPPVAAPEEPRQAQRMELEIQLRDGERRPYAVSTLSNAETIRGLGRTVVTDQQTTLTLWTSDEIPGNAYYDVVERQGREENHYTIVLPPGDDLTFWQFLQLHTELDPAPRYDCRVVPCSTNLPDGYFAKTEGGNWIATEVDPGGGVTNHGNLTGLDADDHLHYLTEGRGDARYTSIAHEGYASPHSGHLIDVGAGANITIDKTDSQRPIISSSGGGGSTSHSDLTDLGADDHLHYHTDARGDVRYTPIAHNSAGAPHSGHLIDVVGGTNVTIDKTDTQRPIINASGSGGVTAHNELTGLGADDHTHYHTDARGDARYTPIAHNSAAAPHSGHLIDVTAGTNITIDKTDPQNPTINATGSATPREPWRVVLSDQDTELGTSPVGHPVAHSGTITKIQFSCDPNQKPTGTASSVMVRRVAIADGTAVDLLTAAVSLLNQALVEGTLGATRDVVAGTHYIEVAPVQNGDGKGFGLAVFY